MSVGTRLMRLVTRKERLGLSPWGWLVLLAIGFLLIFGGVKFVSPFLGVTEPVNGDILVVEGWLPDYAVEQAVRWFRSHDYQCMVTTGGPLPKGHYLSKYDTYAELTAASIKRMGVADQKVIAVPSPEYKVDRTYGSAMALRDWLKQKRRFTGAIDVVSQGAHARRTRLLFEKALGDKITVGIIAARDKDYDPNRWWTTSAGFRTVLDEAIAYVYARVLFYP